MYERLSRVEASELTLPTPDKFSGHYIEGSLDPADTFGMVIDYHGTDARLKIMREADHFIVESFSTREYLTEQIIEEFMAAIGAKQISEARFEL